MSDLTALDSLLSKLPSGWSSPAIANVARLINGRGFKPHEWETDGLPIIRIQNLNGSTDFNYYSGSYNPKIEVNTGDLLFAWSGSRGTSFGPHFWNGPKGVLNYHTWRVKVDESAISPDFFYHALRFLTRIIEDRAHGASALVHVQKWEMEKFGFPCPNDRAEQQAIAAALSDADGVVAGLERVIAKKRLIKQGAMQDLLTARRRLPGFSGEWEVKRLGDVARVATGGRNNQDKDPMGEYPFFVRSDTVERIRSFSYDCEAILVPGEGRIGEIFHYINGRFDVHQRVYCISAFSEETSGRFIYFALRQFFGAHAMINTVKATVDSLRRPTFTGFEFRCPPSFSEQQAIAAVLSDMGAEIKALEHRLAKARAVKEGMMQNLLTGRVRLV